MLHRNYIIQGKVQGVGYRNFTKSKADKLKLKGWVKNLTNGDVECEVVGEKKNIERFEICLKKGPSFSHVYNIEIKISSKIINFSVFEIRY